MAKVLGLTRVLLEVGKKKSIIPLQASLRSAVRKVAPLDELPFLAPYGQLPAG
jgi:hypothetical protein